MTKRSKTLILGIGNILLGDEGIGVRVIEFLQQQNLFDSADIVDGGTAGADLIDIICDRETLILIDAMDASLPPGTIAKLTPQDLLPDVENHISLHDLNFPQTLKMAQLLGCEPKKVIILAVQPAAMKPSMQLSKEIKAVIPEIVKHITIALQ